ncbi:hypothetical protein RchiOBHm_Chr1g0341421 [Rosa chinensis]|uniref:Uncharacterized protein n=1 Tax=Rosa chinensis TaxID=74649 RepID=A0A2P6SDQ4_ROSCH|nr:hypothetical protein RchiOBHm_Chr1g0341421 [Rosa chinensis]
MTSASEYFTPPPPNVLPLLLSLFFFISFLFLFFFLSPIPCCHMSLSSSFLSRPATYPTHSLLSLDMYI